jgi:hypothetical protein
MAVIGLTIFRFRVALAILCHDLRSLVEVDAVCINLSDLEQRCCQVLGMRQIYKGAKETRICLEQADDNTGTAWILIGKLLSAKKPKTPKRILNFIMR